MLLVIVCPNTAWTGCSWRSIRAAIHTCDRKEREGFCASKNSVRTWRCVLASSSGCSTVAKIGEGPKQSDIRRSRLFADSNWRKWRRECGNVHRRQFIHRHQDTDERQESGSNPGSQVIITLSVYIYIAIYIYISYVLHHSICYMFPIIQAQSSIMPALPLGETLAIQSTERYDRCMGVHVVMSAFVLGIWSCVSNRTRSLLCSVLLLENWKAFMFVFQ